MSPVMRKTLTYVFLSLAALIPCFKASAGEPMLSIFKENYITTGLPLNTRPNWDTNDLTFQISLKFNALQNIGGKDWDLFFAYTQMAIWEVYKPSNPFKSNIYTPGIYVYHPFKTGPDGVINDILFGFEHRSNGYDGALSRSIGCLFATYTHTFGGRFTAQLTGRFGIGSIYNDFSFEMLDKYQGYLNAGLCYHTLDRRLMVSASVTPLFKGDIPANINAEIAIRPTRNSDWFYLIARYHYGYDEDQLDCAVPDVFLKHMLRFGLAIQPGRLSHKLFF